MQIRHFYYLEEGSMKSSRNNTFENCNSIGDGSDMHFGPCI